MLSDALCSLLSVGIVGLICFATMFAILAYFGLFVKIEVNTRKKHPFNTPKLLAYKAFTGNYDYTDEHLTALMKVDKNNCRYVVAIVVEDCGERMRLGELVRRLEEAEYRFFMLPGADPDDSGISTDSYQNLRDSIIDLAITPMVHCLYPVTNLISVTIALKRVYPKLRRYIANLQLEAHPFMEFYHKEFIHFLVPCTNNYRYYVPEFCPENAEFGSARYANLVDADEVENVPGGMQTSSA
ncbi:testis-expressed protein 264-like isoform X2 [Convolutriloba macropyga]|uniref:testis-expressed protein 264-like isoform X2 n=1 Tax=Convolutriloba macropyga TaxID=536237 RepID=UPI003F528B0F